MTDWDDRTESMNRRIDEACRSLRHTRSELEALLARMDDRRERVDAQAAVVAEESGER